MLDSLRQGRVLDQRKHRPWPLPDGPWFMAQTWEDLLFAHWPVPAEALRRVMPPQIPLDTHDGTAWLGITPFVVSAGRLRGTPHLPGVTSFPEVNVRTYATIDGRPGIYFLSLDAARRLAVAGARRSFRLPYFHARMRVERRDGSVDYSSDRISRDGGPARLRAGYSPTGAPWHPAPGTLEYFLTERYCLYVLDHEQRVLRADIHHPPWEITGASASWSQNTMAAPFGLDVTGESPLLHLSARQDVVIWRPKPLDA
jgi:uncharacterized protein YqjF (DUF2071 family)